MIDGNTIAANATANITDQSIAIDATSVGSLSLADVRPNDPSAAGTMVIANEQNLVAAVASSLAGGNAIRQVLNNTWANSNSTMSVSDNTVEARTNGNVASASIDLDGTTVYGGAGVLNDQYVNQSTIISRNDSTEISYGAPDDTNDSQVSVDNNAIRAVAVAQSNSTTLNVDAVDFVVDDIDAVAVGYDITDPWNGANAALVAANTQNIDGSSVTARVEDSWIAIENDYDFIDSSVSLDGNTIVAAAYGNRLNAGSADAMVTLNATSINPDAMANVVTALNDQDADNLDLTASVETDLNWEVLEIFVDTDADHSNISNSSNRVQAQTIGNEATTLAAAVDATLIDTQNGTGGTSATGYDSDNEEAYGAFVAINNQSNTGQSSDYMTQTATLLDDVVEPDNSATIMTWIDDDSWTANISSENNVLSAAAIGNTAGTGVVLSATDMTTSTVVSNDQVVDYGEMNALIGIEGTNPTPATTSSNTASTGLGEITVSGNIYTNATGSDLTFSFGSALTAAEAAFYTSAGLTASAGMATATWAAGSTFDATNVSETFTNSLSLNNDQLSISGATTTAAIDWVPNDGGVIIYVGDEIENSDISVASNLIEGSVKGNIATNVVNVSGTNLYTQYSGDVDSAIVDYNMDWVEGDNVVANYQDGWTNMDSTVYGSFGVLSDSDTYGSSIAVDDNDLKATAVMNIASNSIAVGSADAPVVSSNVKNAIDNHQYAEDNEGETISAFADAEVFAQAEGYDNRISLSDNDTRATAIANEAVNAITAFGTNLDSDSGELAEVDFGAEVALADNVVVSRQHAYMEVSAESVVQIVNADFSATSTWGLETGSLSIDGNLNVADAIANRSSNTVSMTAGADMSQTGAILNEQRSNQDVDATASGTMVLMLIGNADQTIPPFTAYPAVDGSSVSVQNNVMSANARGNTTSNVLNAVGANLNSYGSASVVPNETMAQYVVHNNQQSSGAITATAEAALIGTMLNADFGMAEGAASYEYSALNNSSVTVSGNVVQAMASANSAYNAITVSGYDGGDSESAAVNNAQFGSSAVSAIVRNAMIGSLTAGDVGGSTIGVIGNTMSASAAGNRVTSVITRN